MPKTSDRRVSASGRIIAERTAPKSQTWLVTLDGETISTFRTRDLDSVMAEYEASLDKLAFQLNQATQHETVYFNAKPVATIQRRSIHEANGPAWKAYNLRGELIARCWHANPEKAHEILSRRIRHGLDSGMGNADAQQEIREDAGIVEPETAQPQDFNTYREFTTPPAYVVARADKDAKTAHPNDLKWSGENPPPAIGTEIEINFNNLGRATVTGYFCEANWLGVTCTLHDAPAWHRKQRNNDPKAHIFGAEIKVPPQAEPAHAPVATDTPFELFPGCTAMVLGSDPSALHNAIAQAVDEPASEFAEAAAKARAEQIVGQELKTLISSLGEHIESLIHDAWKLREHGQPWDLSTATDIDGRVTTLRAIVEKIECANLLQIL